MKGYHQLIAIRAHLSSNFDTGYPHDDGVDNTAYPHDCHADKLCYRYNRKIQNLNMLMRLGIGNAFSCF